MSGQPSVEEVASLPLFSGLSTEEHARLAALAEVEHHPAGSTVFLEGDPPGDVYLVLEGRVTLCMKAAGQEEACILSLRAGELLGFTSLLHRDRVATARVVRPARLMRMRASDLLELSETDHDIGYALMRQLFEELADRLNDTRRQLLDMFGRSGT